MRRGIQLILLLFILYHLSKIGVYYVQRQSSENRYQSLSEKIQVATLSVETDEDNKLPGEVLLQELKAINADAVAYLDMPQVNISYPVVQGTDNTYYLTKDFMKKDSVAGAIFLDAENEGFTDSNTILYGHYMRNDTMFKNLRLFQTGDLLERDPFFTVTVEGAVLHYRVFNVFVTDEDYDYRKRQFEPGEFPDYISRTVERSDKRTTVKIADDSKILTLSTCSFDRPEGRLVVQGILEKEE